MSGKVLVAVVAVAVSSASAATVGGFVYKMVAPQHGAAQIGVGETASVSGPVKAVVLNASESAGPFADSSADDGGDAP
ncbi:MAG TPA: hypothetical protein VEH77_15825, partial [Roseiarcus sp.]|nr:hypothetical protein [Roseiarcus sp.]